MSDDLVVIDISHWQSDPDWEELKANGILGVILKCTEGSSNIDPTFRERYDAAIAAGLAVSTYHFMRPGSITSQINKYLNTLKPRPGERVCLDHEDPGVGLADLESAVEYLESDSRNLQITIYSGHVIKDQLGDGYSDVLAETSLWLAQYSSTPSWPKGTWPTWSLWQYTDQGRIPGINGNVDANRFNGSAEQCLMWFGPAIEPAPGPEPDDEPEIVITSAVHGRNASVDITATDDMTVNVLVNGDPR